jgi:hypothetical protein
MSGEHVRNIRCYVSKNTLSPHGFYAGILTKRAFLWDLSKNCWARVGAKKSLELLLAYNITILFGARVWINFLVANELRDHIEDFTLAVPQCQ